MSTDDSFTTNSRLDQPVSDFDVQLALTRATNSDFQEFLSSLFARFPDSETKQKDGFVFRTDYLPYTTTDVIVGVQRKPKEEIETHDVVTLYEQIEEYNHTGVIVTTSGFTQKAIKTADDLNLKLVDSGHLLRLIEMTDSYDLVTRFGTSQPA